MMLYACCHLVAQPMNSYGVRLAEVRQIKTPWKNVGLWLLSRPSGRMIKEPRDLQEDPLGWINERMNMELSMPPPDQSLNLWRWICIIKHKLKAARGEHPSDAGNRIIDMLPCLPAACVRGWQKLGQQKVRKLSYVVLLLRTGPAQEAKPQQTIGQKWLLCLLPEDLWQHLARCCAMRSEPQAVQERVHVAAICHRQAGGGNGKSEGAAGEAHRALMYWRGLRGESQLVKVHCRQWLRARLRMPLLVIVEVRQLFGSWGLWHRVLLHADPDETHDGVAAEALEVLAQLRCILSPDTSRTECGHLRPLLLQLGQGHRRPESLDGFPREMLQQVVQNADGSRRAGEVAWSRPRSNAFRSGSRLDSSSVATAFCARFRSSFTMLESKTVRSGECRGFVVLGFFLVPLLGHSHEGSQCAVLPLTA